ncbi:MAG: RagB/SusD family nutrient uptake outer membrane protein, partial [Bacteroidales bacterium]|nr:RagB/SusD family nutrient uptake outer membrane protein [Bacteroidales bacterium]
MKKIFRILFIGALATVTLSSCENFLEVNPRTKVSEAEYFKTEDDMMKGLYNILWEVKHRLLEIHDASAVLSDEAETGGGLGEGQWKYKWDNFTYTPTNCFGEWGYGSWWYEWDYGIYNGVIAANILIDKLEKCTLADSFVKPLLAEAKFFRALFYDYLWMGYEEIPLIKGVLPAEEMYTVHKGTRDEVFDFMMEDLSDDNIAALPARAQTEQGRVCADAARVLRHPARRHGQPAEVIAELRQRMPQRTHRLARHHAVCHEAPHVAVPVAPVSPGVKRARIVLVLLPLPLRQIPDRIDQGAEQIRHLERIEPIRLPYFPQSRPQPVQAGGGVVCRYRYPAHLRGVAIGVHEAEPFQIAGDLAPRRHLAALQPGKRPRLPRRIRFLVPHPVQPRQHMERHRVHAGQ